MSSLSFSIISPLRAAKSSTIGARQPTQAAIEVTSEPCSFEERRWRQTHSSSFSCHLLQPGSSHLLLIGWPGAEDLGQDLLGRLQREMPGINGGLYGDAPDPPYLTLPDHNGARHDMMGVPWDMFPIVEDSSCDHSLD